jgi:hypothetical protein
MMKNHETSNCITTELVKLVEISGNFVKPFMDGTGGTALTVPTISAIPFMNGTYYS